MSTTQAVPQDENTAIQSELYMSFELGDKSWKLTASDSQRGPSRYSVRAGDTEAVLDCVRRAKERCRLAPEAGVHSCYEACRSASVRFAKHLPCSPQRQPVPPPSSVHDWIGIGVSRNGRDLSTAFVDKSGDKSMEIDHNRCWDVGLDQG